MSSESGIVHNNSLFNSYCFVPVAPRHVEENVITPYIRPRKPETSVQPLITSVGLHILCAALLFLVVGKSGSIIDDSAGKAGDDISVIMVEFDNAALSVGESASVASQAATLAEKLNENEQLTSNVETPFIAPEHPNEFSIDIPDQTPVMIDDPKLILPVRESVISEAVPEQPQIVKKTSPTPKKENSVKAPPKKVTPAKADSRLTAPGMGGETEHTRQGSSHAGNASQGANSANTNKLTALSRRVHYPQKATSLKIEGRVKIRFDITDKGSVTNIRVLSEDPAGVFAQSVIKDMSQWKYKTNQSVTNQTVSIVFKLNGSVRISS